METNTVCLLQENAIIQQWRTDASRFLQKQWEMELCLAAAANDGEAVRSYLQDFEINSNVCPFSINNQMLLGDILVSGEYIVKFPGLGENNIYDSISLIYYSTPLSLAVYHGNEPMMEMLLKAGASPWGIFACPDISAHARLPQRKNGEDLKEIPAWVARATYATPLMQAILSQNEKKISKFPPRGKYFHNYGENFASFLKNLSSESFLTLPPNIKTHVAYLLMYEALNEKQFEMAGQLAAKGLALQDMPTLNNLFNNFSHDKKLSQLEWLLRTVDNNYYKHNLGSAAILDALAQGQEKTALLMINYGAVEPTDNALSNHISEGASKIIRETFKRMGQPTLPLSQQGPLDLLVHSR